MTPPLWCQTHQHLSRWSSWQKCLWAAQPTGALPAPLLGWGGDIPRRLEWRFGTSVGYPAQATTLGGRIHQPGHSTADSRDSHWPQHDGRDRRTPVKPYVKNARGLLHVQFPQKTTTCRPPWSNGQQGGKLLQCRRGTPGLCEAATSIFSWVFTGENSQHHGPFQPLPLTWYSGEGNQPYSLPVTGQLHQPIRWCIAPPRGNEWCNGSSTLCQGHNRQAPSADHIRNRSWSLQKLNWHFWGYQRSKGLVCHCDWKCRGCLWDCQEATKILTPSEESFLNAFMKALYKINPSLHNKLSCMKRVDIPYLDIGMGCIFKC